MSQLNVLLVEDEPVQAGAISDLLQTLDCNVTSVASGLEMEELGIERIRNFDAAFVDYRLPGVNSDGFNVARKAREANPALPLVMLTAFGNIDLAVRSLRDHGFGDFLPKPATKASLGAALKRIKQRLCRVIEHGVETGRAACSRAAFCEAAKVANSKITILLRGPKGSGKSMMARYIHGISQRRDNVLKVINCASIPENLLESTLFGHKKGSFTHAVADQEGAFEYASNGTIFFDEIGDLPLQLQPKLNTVLDTGKFCRVGENVSRDSSARVICATNRPLEQMVANGEFRDDLFDRIKTRVIQIPSLSDRADDIEPLAKHLLTRQNLIDSRAVLGFQPDALAALKRHGWPGNVRELEAVVWNCIIETADGAEVSITTVNKVLESCRSAEPRKDQASGAKQEQGGAREARAIGIRPNGGEIWKLLAKRGFKLWKIVDREAVSKQTKDALSKAVLVEDSACQKGSRVQVIDAESANGIPDQGAGLVIIAKVGGEGSLHIRMFDKQGHPILNRGEDELSSKSDELQTLKALIAGIPSSGSLTDDQQKAILDRVAVITAGIARAPSGRTSRKSPRLVDFVPPPPFKVDCIDLFSGEPKEQQIQFESDYYPEPNYIRCLYEHKRSEPNPLPIVLAAVCRYAMEYGKTLQEALREMTETVIVDDMCFVGIDRTRIILGADNLWNMERGALFRNYSGRLKHDPNIHEEIKIHFPDYIPPAQ